MNELRIVMIVPLSPANEMLPYYAEIERTGMHFFKHEKTEDVVLEECSTIHVGLKIMIKLQMKCLEPRTQVEV